MQMAQERVQIAGVLSELPTSWRNVGAALNELQRLGYALTELLGVALTRRYAIRPTALSVASGSG
jgi:hypothetical protein